MQSTVSFIGGCSITQVKTKIYGRKNQLKSILPIKNVFIDLRHFCVFACTCTYRSFLNNHYCPHQYGHFLRHDLGVNNPILHMNFQKFSQSLMKYEKVHISSCEFDSHSHYAHIKILRNNKLVEGWEQSNTKVSPNHYQM